MSSRKSGTAALHLISAVRMLAVVVVLACSVLVVSVAERFASDWAEQPILQTIVEKSQARLQPIAQLRPQMLEVR